MTEITLQSYVDRDRWLVERCRGQEVLHLGCVGFTDCSIQAKVAQARKSLHQQLTEVCRCTGIDLDEATVEQLRAEGVFDNVLVGNVEEMQEFAGRLAPVDLVVAGDIIEHLSNPGRMLDGLRPYLGRDGRLIVSTPSSFGLLGFLRYAVGRYREGAQHVLCFNPITLAQLLERHGYEVVAAFSCHHRHATTAPGPLFQLGRRFFRAFPKFGGTMILESRVRHVP